MGPSATSVAFPQSRYATTTAVFGVPRRLQRAPSGSSIRPARVTVFPATDTFRSQGSLSASAVDAPAASAGGATLLDTDAPTNVPTNNATMTASCGRSSLVGKLRTYLGMVGNDRDYRRGLASMVVNQAGDGLVTGGALLLLTALAAFNPLLAGIGLAVFTLAEILIAAASYIQASHRRDNAEALKRAGIAAPDEEANHGARLQRSGYIDAAASALLCLGLAGSAFLGFTAAPIFVVVVFVKSIQAYNKSYENGAWSCIKYNLGHSETRARQLDMRATIGAFELGIGGLIYGVGSLATVLTLWGLGVAFPPALPFVALGTVIFGRVLTAGAKVWFGRWAARHVGCTANDSMCGAAEATAVA